MLPDDQPTVPTRPPDPARSTPPGVWVAPSIEELQAKLPQYEVIEILGRGGMGAVYKARQKSLRRLVAIKILPLGMADDEFRFTERFQNEAQTMAAMNHPAIVSVYDFGETSDGLLYFVMEFIDGTDVQKMIASSGRLSGEHALAITAHVCDALAYAHKRGVIHRDIKPANILIDQEGHIKVADFGLAKMNDPAQTSGLTKTNMAMGTPDYVAPEVLSPGMVADHRADIYAVGVMLYQMLTGEVPRGMFKLPSQKGIGSDPRFDEIICKAMEQDREERYQSAMDVRHALDVILTTPQAKDDGTGVVAAADIPQKPVAQGPLPPGERNQPPAQKPAQAETASAPAAAKAKAPPKKPSPATMWLSIGGIIAVLGVAGFLVVGGKEKPQPDLGKMDVDTTRANDLPSVAIWQDITATLREQAKANPGFTIEGDLISWTGDKKNPPRIDVTPAGRNDYTIRLKHVGAGQINVRSNAQGFIYVQAAAGGLLINRWMRGDAPLVKLLAPQNIPFSYSKGEPHDLTVSVQGSTIRAWLDGQIMGTVEDTAFAEGTGAVAFVSYGKVQKVEVAELASSNKATDTSWTDWLTPKLAAGSFGPPDWQVDKDGVTTDKPIYGRTLLNNDTRDAAVRLTYELRESSGIQVTMRERKGTPKGREIYFADDTGDTLYISRMLPDGAIKGLSYSKYAGTTARTGTHTLEFRCVGDTLTATVTGAAAEPVVVTTTDATLSSGSVGMVLKKGVLLKKVEIAELSEDSSAWQPIFMKPEDFGGDLRDVEFHDGATFLKTRSKAAPAEPSIVAIRATVRFCASDRTGSLSLRSTEEAPYGEEDFACMAFVSPSGGMVMKVRDRTTGSPVLKRHDFRLSPALKLEESFTFELRAADGKITASINGHEVGSVPDTWKGGARRFSITPSTTEMTEFRDVAVMQTK